MNLRHPVYTEKAECQDCYKCVRHCPVKAIRVENGSATVIAEQCVACGRCVAVCPAGAKRVRDDLERVKTLLRGGGLVVASLAPSYVSEFPDVPPEALVRSLKELGFHGVSETALGAQEVSAAVAAELAAGGPPRVRVSSACPAVVELVNRHFPRHAACVTELCSPLLAHCRLLKREFGADVEVVFIGPCIAKKLEADAHPELLAAAITFDDLHTWLCEEKTGPVPGPEVAVADGAFIPCRAEEGALYPVDGGMAAGIKSNCSCADAEVMAFSGMENLRDVLEGLESEAPPRPLFLEFLACAGGCVNGPCVEAKCGTAQKRFRVIGRALPPSGALPRTPSLDLALGVRNPQPVTQKHDVRELADALATVGKYRREDELNCGGCGYSGCREFAGALLDGKAEKTMCVSHMRKLAQRKANALIRAMPSGVVIVDGALKVVECNRRFAELLGEDAVAAYQARPGLEGAILAKTAPFLVPFAEHVLRGGPDVLFRTARHGGRIWQFSVFAVEPGHAAGAVLRDVTDPSVRKEQVIRQARGVIRKNLAAVQKIAYLLGENAAESQATLNAIIASFEAEPAAPAAEPPEDAHDG